MKLNDELTTRTQEVQWFSAFLISIWIHDLTAFLYVLFSKLLCKHVIVGLLEVNVLSWSPINLCNTSSSSIWAFHDVFSMKLFVLRPALVF